MGTLQQGFGTAAGAANDSFSWSKAATSLSAAGDLAGGIGGLQLANYSSAVASRNSQILAGDAAAANEAGKYAAETQLLRGGQVASAGRAGFGASNIDVNVGSPKAVEQSTKTVSAMDAAITRYNAARQAYGLKTEAAAETAQAGIDKSAGIGSLLSGLSGAGSTLVGGAKSLSGKYAMWQLGQPSGATVTGP